MLQPNAYEAAQLIEIAQLIIKITHNGQKKAKVRRKNVLKSI